MITAGRGNLLGADVDAIVNTVNTVGVMGKGLALQFKRAFPAMYKAYASAAKRGEIEIGRMHVWHLDRMSGPRLVINFPTKRHWRSPSRLADIALGLDDLVRVIRAEGITSIAIPPLGCGNGGLDWAVVEPVIRAKLGSLPDIDVRLFAPAGAPPAALMATSDDAPRLTPLRAALVETIAGYATYAPEGATLIAAQKLMYFLKAAGAPLPLNFVRHHYGPYADGLRRTLSDIEGHYLVGFGDGSAAVQEAETLILAPGAREAAATILSEHPEIVASIQRVLALVDGFESTYSLELLATVHWVIGERPDLADDPAAIAELVQSWNPRKGRMFTRQHVLAAWTALTDAGWVRTPSLA